MTYQRKLTRKQENFAQAIVSGVAIVEAYRRFYSTKNTSSNGLYVNACQLAKTTNVSLRLKELVAIRDAESEATAGFTVEVSRQKLLEIASVALAAKHYGSAVSALVEANKISGFHVQKVEVSGSVTHRDERVAEFTTDELRAWVLDQRSKVQLQAPTIEAEVREVD